MDDLPELLAILRMPEQPLVTLEARLSALVDRQAIHDLVMRYAYLCDARAWDELIECYTEDAERIFAGTLDQRVVGRDAIAAAYEAQDLTRADGGGGLASDEVAHSHLLHLVADEVVRLSDDGSEAFVAARGQLVVSSEREQSFRRGAHEASWAFRLRKESGVWKIARLVVYSDAAHNPMFMRAGESSGMGDPGHGG